jgi:UDP-2,3-diacylglucosamine pyrophosphatase LpxH
VSGARRPVDLVVISDVHLGAACSRAGELNAYLKSIDPGRLVLCGDIIDLWEIRRNFWPETHMKVVRRLLKLALAGVPVHYLTGNHDSALRHYAPFALGQLQLEDRLELNLAGRPTFFVHGDAFDALLSTPRWLATAGSWSYDALVTAGIGLNHLRGCLGRPPVSLAQTFKRNLPAAQRHIDRFRHAVAAAGAERGCSTVVCGHIHVADQRDIATPAGEILYLNAGDWVDSCTALECHGGIWQVVQYDRLVADGLIDPGAERERGETAA